MDKVRYEIDPFNRLVFPGFRKAVDGRFRIDGANNLYYQVRSPLAGSEKVPHQVKFRGEWSLADGHKLRLTLDKWGRQTLGDRLTLEGDIIGVTGNSLLFAATTTSKHNTKTTYALELSGVWKADSRNRLAFCVRREHGGYDALTFTGAWDIGPDKKLIYRYESMDLATKRRRVHSLEFNGSWDINKKGRISYSLGADTESTFDFKVGSGVYGPGFIKYEIGIGVLGRSDPVERTLMLFGRWFVREDVGVVFEIKYSGGGAGAIIFGADARICGADTVSLRLKSGADGKDMGATVELSRRIFKGEGEVFLKALASGKELAIYAGAAWRW